MHRHFLLFTLCLGVAACQGPRQTIDLADFDSNNDGVMAAEEFHAQFDRFDLDGDGFIEPGEQDAIVYEADADRDQRVTRAEFRQIDLTRLEADLNVDGRISQNELEQYERLRLAENTEVNRSVTNVNRQRERLQLENRWINFRF